MSHVTTDDLRKWIPSDLPDAFAEVLNQLPSRRRRRKLIRTTVLVSVLAVVAGLVAVMVQIPTLPGGQPGTDDEV